MTHISSEVHSLSFTTVKKKKKGKKHETKTFSIPLIANYLFILKKQSLILLKQIILIIRSSDFYNFLIFCHVEIFSIFQHLLVFTFNFKTELKSYFF